MPLVFFFQQKQLLIAYPRNTSKPAMVFPMILKVNIVQKSRHIKIIDDPETVNAWAMASSIGVVAVGVAADRKGLALTGAALAAALAVQKPNSRAAESEADHIGIELAAKAGYDPHAAVTLWQKMAKVGGKGPPEFLSTHPAPENREKKLAALVPRMMPYYEQKGDRPFYRL